MISNSSSTWLPFLVLPFLRNRTLLVLFNFQSLWCNTTQKGLILRLTNDFNYYDLKKNSPWRQKRRSVWNEFLAYSNYKLMEGWMCVGLTISVRILRIQVVNFSEREIRNRSLRLCILWNFHRFIPSDNVNLPQCWCIGNSVHSHRFYRRRTR